MVVQKCQFSEGIKYTPDQISGFDQGQLPGWGHEFSRAYRAVHGAESFCIINYYLRLVEHKKDSSDADKDKSFDQYLKEHPEIQQAIDKIEKFRHGVMGLASDLVIIKNRVTSIKYQVYDTTLFTLPRMFGYSSQYVDFPDDIQSYSVISNKTSVQFLLAELVYNATKVAEQRDIRPRIGLTLSEHSFEDLPADVQTRFKSYNLDNYYGLPLSYTWPQTTEEAVYVKLTIGDNSGGFEGDVEKHLEKGASGTGSTGLGLHSLINAQEGLLSAVNIINKPGK